MGPEVQPSALVLFNVASLLFATLSGKLTNTAYLCVHLQFNSFVIADILIPSSLKVTSLITFIAI